MLSRLELKSSYGDKALEHVKFVIYTAPHAADMLALADNGLVFVEGKPIVSTNLIYAHDLLSQVEASGVGEPGAIVVIAVPSTYHIGYGLFTSAYLDMELKRVTGSPVRYAAGRKQMAFYVAPDTEATRVHIEEDVVNGLPVDQRPRHLIDAQFFVGEFRLSDSFKALVRQLSVAIDSLEALRFERFESSFREIMRVTAVDPVMPPNAIHDVVIGTVESSLISRLRLMRWQGLALLGFKFYEGQQEVAVPPVRDIADQRRRMDELGRLLASSSLFAEELQWLKSFAARHLEIMRVELDGAELRSLSD